MQILGKNRALFLILAILPAISLVYAYYLEYYQGLEPCPLCMLQRIPMLFLVVFWGLAFLIYPFAARIMGFLASLSALTGVLLSARHVWIQQLPKDQVPSCGPSFEYLFNNFSWLEALRETIMTSGQCAKIDWQIYGVTLPMLTLLFFMIWFIAGLWVLWKGK